MIRHVEHGGADCSAPAGGLRGHRLSSGARLKGIASRGGEGLPGFARPTRYEFGGILGIKCRLFPRHAESGRWRWPRVLPPRLTGLAVFKMTIDLLFNEPRYASSLASPCRRRGAASAMYHGAPAAMHGEVDGADARRAPRIKSECHYQRAKRLDDERGGRRGDFIAQIGGAAAPHHVADAPRRRGSPPSSPSLPALSTTMLLLPITASLPPSLIIEGDYRRLASPRRASSGGLGARLPLHEYGDADGLHAGEDRRLARRRTRCMA